MISAVEPLQTAPTSELTSKRTLSARSTNACGVPNLFRVVLSSTNTPSLPVELVLVVVAVVAVTMTLKVVVVTWERVVLAAQVAEAEVAVVAPWLRMMVGVVAMF